jgi:hypothetical protein
MQLQILGSSDRYPRARLAEPPPRGYLHLAAVVSPPVGPAPFPRTGPEKTRLLQRLKALSTELANHEGVERADVFTAVVVPPPVGYARRSDVHHARYDVVVLVETTSPEDIGKVQVSDAYQQIHDALAGASSDLHVMPARCVKSLGDVDKSRPGLFLFNYFVAEDPAVALELWDYLAGWYTRQTGLTNSTVLQPIEGADYAFVNHARWDYGVPRFLLQQVTRPSFRRYVLANMLVNRTGAMPLLYHLA